MPRSLGHSAGAAVIVLAAALTSAAPVAADTAAPPDRKDGQSSSCHTSRTERQGIEGVVWSVLFGPQDPTTETRCDGEAAEGKQDRATGLLPPSTGV
jgi:hypothetical protein